MVARTASLSMSKTQQLVQFAVKKIWSVPGIALLAFVGLLLGMCIYYGPLETYAPITNWYHNTLPLSDDWRHLLFRAYPETTFAAWFAQCAAMVAIIGGVIKRHFRVYKTHELFWRPVVGLIFTIPGAAAMAGILWLWNKHQVGTRIHAAAHAFCSAGGRNCVSEHVHAFSAAHPGLFDQLAQSTVLDGQKKLIVIAGSFVFGLWWMKPYFENVQGWLAEHSIITTDAKNASRRDRGKTEIGYTRFYHHLLPGFRDHVRFISKHLGETVPDLKGNMKMITLNKQNHRPLNNFIYRAFKWVIIAGVAGGLYIMFFIAQGTQLAISVVH